MQTAEEREESVESIWTIVSAARIWYLSVFLPLLVSGEVIVIIRAIGRNDGIIDIWYAVLEGSAYAISMSAGLAFATIEIVRNAMVMAHSIKKWVDKKLRESEEKFRQELTAKAREEGRVEGRVEGREEGRGEGREENQKLWVEWNARREDAHARGEDFTEPPPNGKV